MLFPFCGFACVVLYPDAAVGGSDGSDGLAPLDRGGCGPWSSVPSPCRRRPLRAYALRRPCGIASAANRVTEVVPLPRV
jgi:hypothetical protein